MNKKTETWSIVMVVHDEAEMLERNLPLFLTQVCDRQVDVVVVDDASTDNTQEVLKRLKAENPQLYSTFIPQGPYNPLRHRLALSIGVKAAKGDWIVLADILLPPRSDQALEGLAATADDAYGCEVVAAYSGRKSTNVTPYYRTWNTMEDCASILRKVERRSRLGHRGRWFKRRRGLYDAVATPRNRVHDLLHYFDEDLRGSRLLAVRLKAFFC